MNGLSIHFQTEPEFGHPTLADFSKAFGHVVTGGVFAKSREATLQVMTSKNMVVAGFNERMNRCNDIEDATLMVLGQLTECN